MPFCWIFWFSDFPGIRKIGISEKSDFRVFRIFGSPISGNPDFRKSENPDFQISGLPGFRKSGFPDIRKSEFSDFRGIGCRIFRGIRCPASDASGPIEETWYFHGTPLFFTQRLRLSNRSPGLLFTYSMVVRHKIHSANPPTPSAVERARSAGPSLRPSLRPEGNGLQA